MNLTFDGKTVIVTGAAHGIGRAISLAFTQRGASVWACDILEDELVETQRLCAAAGGECTARVVDVTDKAAVDAFVRAASSASGRVEILVNDAGGVL
ncbi:MAG TPA: SDR family NAD(P)-dependent oxidoreductase, partial [Gemmatimonadaceae bacterium]|nr:SDR family NAD(P)-dependent oxidoreductase [Gemmatimonadaceae bacterium]